MAIQDERAALAIRRRMRDLDNMSQPALARLVGRAQSWVSTRLLSDTDKTVRHLLYKEPDVFEKLLHARRGCENRRYVRAELLHEAVLNALHAALVDHDTLARALRTPQPAPLDTTTMLGDVTRRLARLDAAYDAGAFPPNEYAAKRQALLAERGALSVLPTPVTVTPDLGAARAALVMALTVPDLAEVATRLHLRGVLHPGAVLHVTVDV